jgi:hypothetical protein
MDHTGCLALRRRVTPSRIALSRPRLHSRRESILQVCNARGLADNGGLILARS